MQRDWKETFRAFEASGLTATKFCEQQEIAKPTFYYWKKKLGQHSKGSFLQINTEVGPSSSTLTEILYPNGIKLRFSGSLKISDLKALLSV
jgi:hypothetical protein